MSQFPMGDSIGRIQPLLGDKTLPGETDFLRWGLGEQMLARDAADHLRLSDARPSKKRRTRTSINTLETAIPVDNYLPIDPLLRPAALQPSASLPTKGHDVSIAAPKIDDETFQGILEVFPDISHQYVHGLLTTPPRAVMNDGHLVVGTHTHFTEDLIEHILAQKSYPKQGKAQRIQEQIEDDDDKKWDLAAARAKDPAYSQKACAVLGQEFPRVPVAYIREVVSQKQSLYAAYLDVYGHESSPTAPGIPYSRLKQPRVADVGKYFNFGGLAELEAVKRRIQKGALALQKQNEDAELERRNKEESARDGTLVECQCCYIDTPLNRTMPCEGEIAHFFCFACIRKSAETQIGLMKWRLQCFDISGCQEHFNRSLLEQTLGPALMKKLDSLQQEDEIQQACLEGLESCPFCDFKAICGSVEEDREFHCQNPSCEKVSCRVCKAESHLPKTCKEARQEKGLPQRHAIEEAMSEALIRNCPKCKVNIVKEDGCNRMTCSKCGCHMCYICRKDISKEMYSHFGRAPSYCKTHDDLRTRRHEEEVERAQNTAISEALSQNPELTEKDLRVYKATASKPSVPAQQPKREVPADQPFHRAYEEVRQARMYRPQQPLQPRTVHVYPRLRPNAAADDQDAFNLYANLPPIWPPHYELWKGEGEMNFLPPYQFVPQRFPRDPPPPNKREWLPEIPPYRPF